MAKTVQGACAEARLDLIDDVLNTAGWTKSGDGWSPPDRYREAIERTHGRGHWSRDHAIMFTVRGDEHVVKADAAS